jgi:hypothetical protein
MIATLVFLIFERLPIFKNVWWSAGDLQGIADGKSCLELSV